VIWIPHQVRNDKEIATAFQALQEAQAQERPLEDKKPMEAFWPAGFVALYVY
jgi:hypothetical protein